MAQRQGRSPIESVKTVAALWWSGVMDALQLQRCVVACVLDGSGAILSRMGKCAVLNGGVYLASILWHDRLVDPAVAWLLRSHVEPAYGPRAAEACRRALRLVLHAAWLLPLYVISLVVSCIWYQQMAVAACDVRQRQLRQQQQQQQQQEQEGGPAASSAPASAAPRTSAAPPAAARRPSDPSLAAAATPGSSTGGAAGGSSGSSSGGGGAAGALEGVAQELYRVLFFLVFSLEVQALSLVPWVGRVANVLFLSWLYAFYCFDYAWGLQGVPLPERMAFFERRWAFFAGFGLPCTLPTLLMPFHVGSALLNLLFPVFVLVACASDPAAKHARLGRSGGSGRIPIFAMALRPTSTLIAAVMGRLLGRSKRQ